MFTAERWAAAFMETAGDDAGGAFAVLKVLAASARRISGVASGLSASKRLERIIRQAVVQVSGQAADWETEIAARFLLLLVRRNGMGHLDPVFRAIEAALDRKNGVISALIESAQPLDGEYLAALQERIQAGTGAKEVRLQTRLLPELLGGCRLRIGSDYLDASLRCQLEKMAANLGADTHVSGGAVHGGFSW